MAFKFKFPTLKQLAMLSLGRYWINEKALPIDHSINVSFLDKVSVEKVHQIVEHTKLPSSLKRELIHVLNGICCIVAHWKFGVSYALPNVNINEYVLDVHGQLDDELTWDMYFETKLGQVQDEHELMNLLEIAIKQSLLLQIDKILKKIVHLVDKGDAPKLLGLDHEICHDGHVLVYSFNKELDAQTTSNLISLLNSKYVFVCNRRIVLRLGNIHLSFLLFQQHYILLKQTEREPYFKSIIGTLLGNNKISVIVKIFQFVDAEYPRLLELGQIGLYVLKHFIDWPYNQFFLPALGAMITVLDKYDCTSVFTNLIERTCHWGHHDTSYDDLLLAFLQNLLPEMKRMVFHQQDDFLKFQMTVLKLNNVTLYHKVSNIIPFDFNHPASVAHPERKRCPICTHM